jgi:OOP family OmpA-OmpF porin
MPRHRPIALLLALAALAATACTAGTQEAARGQELRVLLEEIYDRGYRCSGKELALATAHVDFGLRELEQGDFLRAREHMDLAHQNARKADIQSRGQACLPPKSVAAKPSDRDGDGIVDPDDTCPDEPEDLDGYQDRDGCPDPDNDADTILDVADSCPDEPEDMDGDRDTDGCPDIDQDRDKDGLADNVDKCPDQPEDKDGFRDDDGCPDPDNDKDGLADAVDKCPMEPEDFDKFEDEDGCPDNDNDNDGIVDATDQCPNEPEDYDGDADEDGCPDLYKLVVVTDSRIELKQKVHFATGKSTILSDSFPLLNEVAQVLLDRPKITSRIEGHTDSRGSDKFNQRLSQGRANSVRTYLMRQGIASSRVDAVGLGEDVPIEDNTSSSGRAANRRVEFHITAQ